MKKTKLPPELTKVTPVAKFVSAVLFIWLPIIAFLLGIRYQIFIRYGY